MKNRTIPLIMAVAALLAAGTVSCRREVKEPSPPRPSPPAEQPGEQPPATQTETVRVYFARGEELGVCGRAVEVAGDTASSAELALEQLLDGPDQREREWGFGTTIPENVRVLGVQLEQGKATVDLSREFASGGGSLSMQMRAAQVVFTLTQFADIEQVAFALEGERIDALGGEGVRVGPSVDRSDFEDMSPAILVESPLPGEEIASPVTVRGSSNTFEATHQINVTDPDGLIVAQRTVTATSGTGTRGTWEEAVDFAPPKRSGWGAVICFEYSAKDGSQINVVEVPVQMR